MLHPVVGGLLFAFALALTHRTAQASIAYGSINNFDTVNDTSNVCHGFEIELDDIQTTDITYTYDYNHYGTPKILADTTTVPGHTNVRVRYEAVYSSTSGWSAYTAIPTNAIPPTQGHAFTNPSLNFGGEHFGVGYSRQPTKVLYHWLVDDGSHTLALGPEVNVSTPTFTGNYVGNQVQVAPVIPAPVLPPPPSLADPLVLFEFSDATWVKVITTTSHTNAPMPLRDLITPDANNPGAKDWRHGEPDEVETEWQLLQTDFKSADFNPTNGIGGKNGKLAGAGHVLSNSDDVVTYRCEYYAYVGPYADWDTHEALCEKVAPDGIHGLGTYVDQDGYTNDLSTMPVVGRFLGAQMSAVAPASPIGLIDHLPDAEENTLYPTRCVVIAGETTNLTITCNGLPDGMTFEADKGWIGNTPSVAGVFMVTVSVSSTNRPVLTKTLPLVVAPAGVALAPHSAAVTSVSPAGGGVTTGEGVYTNGTTATVTAMANPGYGFLYWTENGVIVSTSPRYEFTSIVNQSLVANFGPQLMRPTVLPHALRIAWLTNFSGCVLQQNVDPRTSNWGGASNVTISVVDANYEASIPTTNGACSFRLMHP